MMSTAKARDIRYYSTAAQAADEVPERRPSGEPAAYPHDPDGCLARLGALDADGYVTAEGIEQLADRRADVDGQRLAGARLSSRAPAGLDATYGAPKTVSLLHARARELGDAATADAVEDSMRRAVHRAEDYLDRNAAVIRRRERGSRRLRRPETGSVLYMHQYSRAGEPHLHVHALRLPVGRMPDDGAWYSLDHHAMVTQQHAAGALFRAELARQLRERGVPMRHDTDDQGHVYPQVTGVPLHLSQRASTRRRVVAEALDTHSAAALADTAAYRQSVVLASRERKTDTAPQITSALWADASVAQLDDVLRQVRQRPVQRTGPELDLEAHRVALSRELASAQPVAGQGRIVARVANRMSALDGAAGAAEAEQLYAQLQAENVLSPMRGRDLRRPALEVAPAAREVTAVQDLMRQPATAWSLRAGNLVNEPGPAAHAAAADLQAGTHCTAVTAGGTEAVQLAQGMRAHGVRVIEQAHRRSPTELHWHARRASEDAVPVVMIGRDPQRESGITAHAQLVEHARELRAGRMYRGAQLGTVQAFGQAHAPQRALDRAVDQGAVVVTTNTQIAGHLNRAMRAMRQERGDLGDDVATVPGHRGREQPIGRGEWLRAPDGGMAEVVDVEMESRLQPGRKHRRATAVHLQGPDGARWRQAVERPRGQSRRARRWGYAYAGTARFYGDQLPKRAVVLDHTRTMRMATLAHIAARAPGVDVVMRRGGETRTQLRERFDAFLVQKAERGRKRPVETPRSSSAASEPASSTQVQARAERTHDDGSHQDQAEAETRQPDRPAEAHDHDEAPSPRRRRARR